MSRLADIVSPPRGVPSISERGLSVKKNAGFGGKCGHSPVEALPERGPRSRDNKRPIPGESGVFKLN